MENHEDTVTELIDRDDSVKKQMRKNHSETNKDQMITIEETQTRNLTQLEKVCK